MRFTAILNPIAGGGYASEIKNSILEGFRDFDIELHVTGAPGDATRIAAQAAKEHADYLICIGGDGTLNEVVQSLAHTETVLIPISAGTGSDFIKTLGIRNLNGVISSINGGKRMEMDLGKVRQNGSERYFINILEVGFGATVMERVNSRKKVRGGGSFTSSVLAKLISFRPYEVHITTREEEFSSSMAELIVANGRYFGGGMLAAPQADIQDGMFDVHLIRGVGRAQMIAKLRKLKDGSYTHDPIVKSFRTDHLEINGSAPVEMDGENCGTLPISVGIERNALRVIKPWVENEAAEK